MRNFNKLPAVRKTYFIVTGEIVFQAPGTEDINAVRTNAIIISDNGKIPAALLGKAQQSLQLSFHQKMGENLAENTSKVIDVIFLNVSRLGEFTEEEFQAAVPGTKLQEVKPEEVANEQTN